MKRIKPKTLTGLSQKERSRLPHFGTWGTRIFRAAGVEAGTNFFMLLERNTVSPTTRLTEASRVARHAEELTGKGCWRKRMPSGNRVDRDCNIILPRKRADFQQVVHYERTRRTFAGGNRK